MTAGLLVMGLLKTPLRWSGVLLILATIWAARLPVPDVLVAGDGRTFAAPSLPRASSDTSARNSATSRALPRDATPRPEDIEADQ